ncbi:MAG: hypothetical protein AB1457_02645 [Chloroflexota bacterium]|nr:MAG: hypothetical protein KatS3mg047_0867 [Bellilinea sp.]
MNQQFDEDQNMPEDTLKSHKQTSDPLREAWKQVENIGQTLGEALQSRGNVVMVRVNDETLRHLDMLVEAEIAKSRSEAAALLINEGIKHNAELFSHIQQVTDQIIQLRIQLKKSILNDYSINE